VEIVKGYNREGDVRRMALICEKPCVLCGEHFIEGEGIEVAFPADTDLAGGQSAGPWEPGGYTSRWIRDHAMENIEGSRGKHMSLDMRSI
jgi:hypothetical protein